MASVSKNQRSNRGAGQKTRMYDGQEVRSLKVSILTGKGRKRSIYIGGYIDDKPIPQPILGQNGVPLPLKKIGRT